MFDEADYLMVSGVQHFLFCRRQWALIHVEQEWSENTLTYKGEQLHERADDPQFHEKRGEKRIIRALAVHSVNLGLSGRCDIVEFTESKEGAYLYQYEGTYTPCVVEYKHGRKKHDLSDTYQLLGASICLEEMLGCEIQYGDLYYFETKERIRIQFTKDMRMDFKKKVAEMHDYWKKRYTPKVKPSAKCKKCSLENICLPNMLTKPSASAYLKGAFKL